MNKLRRNSNQLLIWIQDIGLLIISIATIFAIGIELMTMLEQRHVSLADLLLLFIYLEILAMASIYLKSGKLPVRIPLYITIVALARYMILDMKNLDTWRMLAVAGAVLIIAFAILVIRYGHNNYPYTQTDDD
ncbi:MAG TPA: phosphate-starvation-inducible PsiE family protein [Gammaproteobacteria bacterium]